MPENTLAALLDLSFKKSLMLKKKKTKKLSVVSKSYFVPMVEMQTYSYLHSLKRFSLAS